jgi:hypothetical protein
MENIPSQLDLVLVVTPAHCRALLIEKIAYSHEVRSWIIEKVLAQSCEQLDHITKTLSGCRQAWVNTPRRLMGWHKQIRANLSPKGNEPLLVQVTGGNWGMACNAIHFIDLVAWWTESQVVTITCSDTSSWSQSKRVGFQEIFGALTIKYANGSQLELCCCAGDGSTQISVSSKQGKWLIDESAGRATGPVGQKLDGRLSFQSELTAPLVKQILQEGHCELPNLAESAALHRPLLHILLKHWNQSQGCQSSVVPIT